jgi:hypothetical protein
MLEDHSINFRNINAATKKATIHAHLHLGGKILVNLSIQLMINVFVRQRKGIVRHKTNSLRCEYFFCEKNLQVKK